MKKIILSLSFVALLFAIGCNKDENEESACSQYTCFECANCQGQYAHLMNGEYCVDGFDNCDDWLDAKNQRETNNACDCQFTQ